MLVPNALSLPVSPAPTHTTPPHTPRQAAQPVDGVSSATDARAGGQTGLSRGSSGSTVLLAPPDPDRPTGPPPAFEANLLETERARRCHPQQAAAPAPLTADHGLRRMIHGAPFPAPGPQAEPVPGPRLDRTA